MTSTAATDPPSPDDTQPLHIAMVAPPWFEVPPDGYGGIEYLVAGLVDQLVARGHHVTLIASGSNQTRAQDFVQVYEEPPSGRLGTAPVVEVIHAAITAQVVAERAPDVVHDHSLVGPLLARGRRGPSTVVTMHAPAVGESGDYIRHLGDTVDVVAISEAQRETNPDIHWVGRVYNGIDVDSFPFRADKDDYVLWMGRFNEDKGAHLAIDAARAAGRRIVLAGKCEEPHEQEFFDAEIQPRMGDDVEYVGAADADEKRDLMGGARCLVFPLQWEEPFGLVMTEAMACGTPVVALRRGSVPEIVRDGVTGYVLDDLDGFPRAIVAADDLDPAECRRHTATHFDLPVMAEGYEGVYRELVEGRRALRSITAAGAP